jgi:hypothetical protein
MRRRGERKATLARLVATRDEFTLISDLSDSTLHASVLIGKLRER